MELSEAAAGSGNVVKGSRGSAGGGSRHGPALQTKRVRVEAGQHSALPASARTFETRWAEEQWLREIMEGAQSPARASIRTGDELFVAQALSRRDLIHRRLAHGFMFFGGEVGGRQRAAFREEGLRSDLAHVLRRVVAMAPRTRRMQVGRDKAVMHSTDAKVLGLDEPWIVLNGTVRGLFRIDLDFTFVSWTALRQELIELFLPCLPNIAVGFECEDGRIERPHLLYMLPADGMVWFSNDKRCRRDIMNLWRGVHAGLTKALLPLGADPGALANPMRIKNPLSPLWSVRVWNEGLFPTLSDWSGWVDTSSNREAMIRESASKLAGTSRKASNALFTTFQERAYATLAEWQREGDAEFKAAILQGDRDRLAERLFRTLVEQASREADNPKQAQAILYRVVAYAADRWDPSRCSRNGARDRGACLDRIEGIGCVRKRQGVGARYAAERRRDRTCETIRRTIAEIEVAGERVTKLGVSRRSGLSRPTVIANWPCA